MKATVQIQKRFQVTVPEAIRNALELQIGDFIEIDVRPTLETLGARKE